jgi:hypothetical protein
LGKSDLIRHWSNQGQLHGKFGAGNLVTAHFDLAAVGFNDLADNAQTQSNTGAVGVLL